MSKVVTVHDVAAKANVSTASVSRVMNGSAFVSDATSRRVRKAIDELGFEPNASARKLRQQQTHNIGLVVSEFSNPFFPSVISAAVNVAGENGYSIFVIAGDNPEEEVQRLVASRSVDGVLLVHSGQNPASVTALNDLRVPVVAFDRAPSELAVPLVQTDNGVGGAEVVQHLIDTGCERIAHVTGPEGLSVSVERRDAYEKTLKANGVSLDEQLVIPGDFSEQSGAAAVEKLLDLPSKPDAIFAANDLMAIGAMSSAKNLGLDVPRELAIAGFDGIAISGYVTPALTTYAQAIDDVARVCVSMLLERLQNPAAETSPDGDANTIKLKGELVVRESTQQRAEVTQ